MAGHSHWANIAAKKSRIDKKRGKLFGKLSRAIIVAAQHGGRDPDMNLALRYAVDKARKNSMPAENIDRAIKKGCGESDGDNYEELVYEGYGTAGVAVLCDALTENRNRTAGELRKVFEVHGGNLGGSGSVAWMFDRRGLFLIPGGSVDEESLLELVLDAGAEDMKESKGDSKSSVLPPHFRRFRMQLKLRTFNQRWLRLPGSRRAPSILMPVAGAKYCNCLRLLRTTMTCRVLRQTSIYPKRSWKRL